ncbi:MAG: phage tail sheath family protein [Flavobacteriales bacterium]|nr:phage tail sheath family protein [Flavobacteriales bacterium]
MATYSTPGAYIQEIATLPASVAQVNTAIPAFIGLTEDSTNKEPTRISSMAEFVEAFGGAPESVFIVDVNADVVASAVVPPAPNPTKGLYYHMLMYFSNGGGPCYIVSVGGTASVITQGLVTLGLAKLKLEDEPTLIVVPEAIFSATAGALHGIAKECLSQCNTLQDRFTIMDLHNNTSDHPADALAFRGGVGTQYLKYGAAYYPQLTTSLPYDDASVKITYTAGADLDIPAALLALTAASVTHTLKNLINAANDTDAADYLTVGVFISKLLSEQLGSIRDKVAEQSITVGPSASMAGIYASVDRDRGVWKAPANVSMNSVSEPTFKLNSADQDDFNVSPTGKSINVIRSFTGKGNIVWGARTLAGNDNEWRYVPVRRLFITAEESIKKATEFVVFEPNDKNTWERVRAMISNYLTVLWRQGALAGAKPEDAFFVNVGLGETMSADDILNGKLIVEIGMAAVRPAEFIILNFSHKLQES